MELGFRTGDLLIRLAGTEDEIHRTIREDHRESCIFAGQIELDTTLTSSLHAYRHSSDLSSSSTSSSSPTSHPTSPISRMSGRAKSVTHLHSFQLALEPPTSLPPQSLPSEPIINFTGAEYIPSSLIQLGSPSKITGTFTSICPFSVEIPLDLLPPQSNHHDQEYVYSLSVIAWFKVTDLSNPHAPRLLSTPSAQTAFTIRRSHGSSRRIGIDSVMDSFKGMDIEMEHHTVRPSFMGPGWHRNGL